MVMCAMPVALEITTDGLPLIASSRSEEDDPDSSGVQQGGEGS
jgi:hypothetical protein